ncbi:MAG: hypothetical protein K5930_12465 [Treponemataceae bacterium]|nr:hypothetical protein [Treponemataceae bacterium]
MAEREIPRWAEEIPEGSFISYEPTYKVGEFFDRFHKESFNTPEKGAMTYYFYDPTEHGFPKDKSYPLFVFLHGASNSLEKDICINYTGAEFYSKEEYQSVFGGAYLLIPLANEYRDEEGKVKGGWDESYVKPVYQLIRSFIDAHSYGDGKALPCEGAASDSGKRKSLSGEMCAGKGQGAVYGASGRRIVFGNSAGATMSFRMVTAYTSFFYALIPIGTGEIASDQDLDRYEEKGVHLFFAIGKHDEINPYQELILPRLPRLERMKNCFIYTPEWVRNGDKGIASIHYGFEMGQHCLINPMHCNLMYDDGTPMEERLPQGVTGWLKDILKE